jgi:hypothetical protein
MIMMARAGPPGSMPPPVTNRSNLALVKLETTLDHREGTDHYARCPGRVMICEWLPGRAWYSVKIKL